MWLTEKQVNRIKEDYPIGTRVKLINMDDIQAVPKGTIGTVTFVDDQGQLQMSWDNGRSLALIPNVDQFEVLSKPEQKQDRIKVVIVAPDQHPYTTDIENSLKKMQEIVGGYIECIDLENNITLVCDEEGKLKNSQANRSVSSEIIVGTFFITKTDGENFVSLSETEAETYMQKFHDIEQHTQEEAMSSSFDNMYRGM